MSILEDLWLIVKEILCSVSEYADEGPLTPEQIEIIRNITKENDEPLQ
jgi:hypothetical protein